MRRLIDNICQFYRRDCCWPYALSFYLALVIYWLDFVVDRNPRPWASPAAFGIILAYYLYGLRLFVQHKAEKSNPGFFLGFLTFKTIVWGGLLAALYLTR